MNNELVKMKHFAPALTEGNYLLGFCLEQHRTMDVSAEGWASFAPLAASLFSLQTWAYGVIVLASPCSRSRDEMSIDGLREDKTEPHPGKTRAEFNPMVAGRKVTPSKVFQCMGSNSAGSQGMTFPGGVVMLFHLSIAESQTTQKREA